MVITVRERDEKHMSHDSHHSGVRMWDVLQGEVLVGTYHNETEALRYKELLESGRLEKLKAPV